MNYILIVAGIICWYIGLCWVRKAVWWRFSPWDCIWGYWELTDRNKLAYFGYYHGFKFAGVAAALCGLAGVSMVIRGLPVGLNIRNEGVVLFSCAITFWVYVYYAYRHKQYVQAKVDIDSNGALFNDIKSTPNMVRLLVLAERFRRKIEGHGYWVELPDSEWRCILNILEKHRWKVKSDVWPRHKLMLFDEEDEHNER